MFRPHLNNEHDKASVGLIDRRLFAKAMIGAVAAGVFVGLGPFKTDIALAVTSAEKQAEADAVKKRLDEWAVELDKASADYFTALEAHDAAVAKMNEADATIAATEAELGVLQKRIADRATSMYKGGETSFLGVLFGATSFTEFATTWDLLTTIGNDDAALIASSKKIKQEAQDAHDEYAAQEKISLEKQSEAEEIKNKAEEIVIATEAELSALEAEVSALLEEERLAEERRQQAIAAAAAANGSGNYGGNYPNAPTYNPITGNAVVDRAYGCIGLPYVWGATGPSSFDCSGLVGYALTGTYSRIGTTYTFMGWGRVSDPQPGDVCTNSSHAGIYIGGGQMIHAPYSGKTVCVAPVQSSMIFVRR